MWRKIFCFWVESESKIGELHFEINRGVDKLFFAQVSFYDFLESK